MSRFNLTRAVVETGSLSVDPFVSSTGDRSLVNGRWYSDKAPVVGLLAVPTYAFVHVGHRIRGVEPEYRAFSTASVPAARLTTNLAYQQSLFLCSLMTSGLGGVVVGLLLFELLRRRTTTRAAFFASSAVLLGTPLLAYSTSLYGHVPAAAFVLAAIFCLDPRGAKPRGAPPSPKLTRIAGACLGLCAGSEYLMALPVALVGLLFLAWLPAPARWPAIVNLAIGAAIPVIGVCLYHTLVFGAPWRTGYSFEERPEFAAGHSRGLLGIQLPRWDGLFGLTVGTRRGLFYIAPLALLGAVFGVRSLLRRRDWAFEALLAVLVGLWLLNSGYYMWWGGASAGPRHLVPGFAFVALGAAIGFRHKHRAVRVVTAVLAVISVVNGFAIVFAGIEPPEYGDILRDFVWPRVLEGNFSRQNGATTLGRMVGLPAPVSFLPLLAWVVVGYGYLWRQLVPAGVRNRGA